MARKFPYQVKYRKELDVVERSEINNDRLIRHFSERGYENLYVTEGGIISSVITISDYLSNHIVSGLDRDFIWNDGYYPTSEQLSDWFINRQYIDRISVIVSGELICEIDGLIELPLQNGLAKNLVALRYIDLFKEELAVLFKSYKRVLLIAPQIISDMLKRSFNDTVFDIATDSSVLSDDSLGDRYDKIFDFVHSKNVLKAVYHLPQSYIGFNQLITVFAIKRIVSYCERVGAHVLFYRIPDSEEMTCLNQLEKDNASSRFKTGYLLDDSKFMNSYLATKREREFLRNRLYHASMRMDDGFCFVQDECNEPEIRVHKGIRQSSGSYSEDAINVYFYGPCITYGFLMPDDMTIPALVYRYANDKSVSLNVINKSGIHGFNELNTYISALATPIRQGDILVFYDTMNDLDISEYPGAILTSEWFNDEKPVDETWFLDAPWHCNYKANGIIARHIFDDIYRVLGEMAISDEHKKRTPCFSSIDRFRYMQMTHSAYLSFHNKYKSKLFEGIKGTIGAMVINPDQSYKDSLKLAEKAIRYCDALYLFRFNVDLEDICGGKELFEQDELIITDKPVRVLDPGYFFYSGRYVNSRDNIDEYVFTETAFAKTVLNELSVTIRFMIHDSTDNNNTMPILREIYNAEGIQLQGI